MRVLLFWGRESIAFIAIMSRDGSARIIYVLEKFS